MTSIIKQYKLVPTKIYESLVNNQNNEIKKDLHNSTNNTNSTSTSNSNRSIKDIQENTLSQKQFLAPMVKRNKLESNTDINEQNSKENDSHIKTDDLTNSNGVLRVADGNNLTWIHSNPTQLPQFSNQNKIESLHDQYNYILNANNIPQNIKLKLMDYIYNKYKRSKVAKNNDDINDEIISSDDEFNRSISNIEDTDQKAAISDVIANTPSNMLNIVNKVATQLLRQKKYIKWSAEGKILYPVEFFNSKIINIDKLIRLLTYNDAGSQNELRAAQTIIKPFYKTIKTLVRNKKIQSAMTLLDYHKGSTSGRKSHRYSHLRKNSYIALKR